MPSHSLEQEAMERVSRMYSSFDRRPPERRPPGSAPEPPRREPPRPDREPGPEPPPKPDLSKQAGLLDVLMKDKEQSLIMLLLIILMKDGADMNLLLALLYLLI